MTSANIAAGGLWWNITWATSVFIFIFSPPKLLVPNFGRASRAENLQLLTAVLEFLAIFLFHRRQKILEIFQKVFEIQKHSKKNTGPKAPVGKVYLDLRPGMLGMIFTGYSLRNENAEIYLGD